MGELGLDINSNSKIFITQKIEINYNQSSWSHGDRDIQNPNNCSKISFAGVCDKIRTNRISEPNFAAFCIWGIWWEKHSQCWLWGKMIPILLGSYEPWVTMFNILNTITPVLLIFNHATEITAMMAMMVNYLTTAGWVYCGPLRRNTLWIILLLLLLHHIVENPLCMSKFQFLCYFGFWLNSCKNAAMNFLSPPLKGNI